MSNDVVFWQNIPSYHQAGAVEHFCKLWPGCVYGIYDMEMSATRKACGWQTAKMQGVSSFFLDKQKDPARFVEEFIETHIDAIHVLGGFSKGCLSVHLASKQLLKRYRSKQGKPNIKMGFVAEQPSAYGAWLEKMLRFTKYRLFFLRHAKKFQFGLAMGKAGVDCYAKLGCPRKILFPYVYQCNSELPPNFVQPKIQEQEVKFIYIGGFSHRKGIDILGAALRHLPPTGWKLSLVGGGGDLESQTLSWAEQMDQVSLLGQCPSDKIVQKIAEHDVCIIPSRYDGWGMVTNESIHGGTGTIVSAAARSCDLIGASGAGKVFPAGSVRELAEAMKLPITDKQTLLEWKERARCYLPCIQKEMIGQYLFDVMRYVFLDPAASRPEAKWLAKSA